VAIKPKESTKLQHVSREVHQAAVSWAQEAKVTGSPTQEGRAEQLLHEEGN
jgi:hypothetical protein